MDTNSNSIVFPGLKPSERIRKFVEDHIFPDLEKLSFKINKASTIKITKRAGDLTHEIYFQQFSWNGTEVVTFLPHFRIRSPTYLKWHTTRFGKAPSDKDLIMETDAFNMPNWNRECFHSWYDLDKDDNIKLARAINVNIHDSGLLYFNQFADFRNTVMSVMSINSYYYKAPMLIDFALILDDKKLAAKVLDWFDIKAKEGTKFLPHTLEQVETRKKILSMWPE